MPKLQKFKKDNKKITTKNMIMSLSIIMCLLIVVVITKSYAIYKMQKEFDVIKNQIGNYSMGDVRVAVLVDGKETDTFPSYETNYKVESIECSNGVNAYWNVENWELRISDMSATSTKCIVSFNSKETNETTPVSYTKEELIALNEEIKNTSAKELADYLYPVGSIYMSTEDDTIEKVQDKFGGTWVRYAEGTMLMSVDSNHAVNTTGGSSIVKLTEKNLPNHMHTTPSTSTGNQSSNHTHSIPALSGSTTATTTSQLANGNGGYANNAGGNQNAWTVGTQSALNAATWTIYIPSLSVRTNASTTGGISANHNHILPSITTNECLNCDANDISIQNPYTAVYMYKRTA